MKPAGHKATLEDRHGAGVDLPPVPRPDQLANTPQCMSLQMDAERYFGIECIYTHYSRDEQVGIRSGFYRRFSRPALDPFVAAGSNIRTFQTDEEGYAIMTMGDI